MRFDFDTPIDRTGTWSKRWDKHAGRDVLPLWVADTDFRMPEPIRDAMRGRLDHGVLGYTAAPVELKEVIAERMARLHGWRVQPDWIEFLPGVVPGLYLAARSIVPPGGHMLVPTPIYHHFRWAPDRAQRDHTDVPLVLQAGRWVFDEDQLERSVRPGTRMLYLCNPQNPGGTIFTRAELERVAAFAARHDLVICSDEIHSEILLDDNKPHIPIASLSPEIARRTITLNSANKAFNFPAAGCGWAIVEDPALRSLLARELHGPVHDPSVFGYIGTLAAYRHPDCARWLAAELDYVRGNRDIIEASITRMSGLSMAHVEASYLAWIDCTQLGVPDPEALFLAHGVALSPGSQFGAPSFVRLNFGTQRARVATALERIAAAVASVR